MWVRNAQFAEPFRQARRSTLSSVDGYLKNLLDCDGDIFVDRDPAMFPYVLAWLRDGRNMVLPQAGGTASLDLLRALRREAPHFAVNNDFFAFFPGPGSSILTNLFNICKHMSNFGGLVLSSIEAEFCK